MNKVSLQARSIFERLVFEEPESSERLIDQLCESDPDLIDQVTALLRAHRLADSMLEAPLGEKALSDTRSTLGVGDRLGLYTLKKLIGSGGFGHVFEAQQTKPVQRTVAIKLIKPGMDSEDVLRRFDNERQSLAILNHPNIAKVLEAGTCDRGRPYFVMDLVRGSRLTDFCDTHHLSTRERLELFIQVCKAVQHAHQKGVVHRDLKPSNVLVDFHDGAPVAKVIDFGIAKITGQSELESRTHTLSLLGTPLYMSPEQAKRSRDVDTRSDIYSLGAILYELLTGDTPLGQDVLENSDGDDIRKLIQTTVPEKPSSKLQRDDNLVTLAERRGVTPLSLIRTIRGDLDWITMKALEKDRERRYSSAEEFSADVQRWMNREAIKARPPSRVYAIQKSIRQHRVLLSMVAFTMLVLSIATAFTMRQTRLANEAKQKAQIQARLSQMATLLDASRPKNAGQNLRVADLGANLKKQLDQMEGDSLEKSKVYFDLGMTYDQRGLFEKSIGAVEQSLTIRERCEEGDPKDFLEITAFLAFLYSKTGDDDERSQAMCKRATELADSLDVDKRTFVSLVHRNLAKSRVSLNQQNFLEAERFASDALDLASENKFVHAQLVAWTSLCWAQSKIDVSKALKTARIAHEFAVDELGEENFDTFKAADTLANVLLENGKFDEAIEIFRDNIPNLKQKLHPNHHRLALSHISFSQALSGNEKLEEAWKQLHKAKAIVESKGFNTPDVRRRLWEREYVLLCAEGKEKEATSVRRKILEDAESCFGPNSPGAVSEARKLACSLLHLGEEGEARKLLTSVLSGLDPKSLEHRTTQLNLSTVLFKTGCHDEAISLLTDIVSKGEQKKQPTEDREFYAIAKGRLGMTLISHRPDELSRARELTDAYVSYYEQGKKNSISLAAALRRVGTFYQNAGHFDDAVNHLSKSLKARPESITQYQLGRAMWSQFSKNRSDIEELKPEDIDRLKEIEKHLTSAYQKLKQQSVSRNLKYLKNAAAALIELYEFSGEVDKASKWQARFSELQGSKSLG